jgi:hypothetical protein
VKLESKFSVGDVVYSVHVFWGEKRVTCPVCLGTREWTITTPDGETWKTDCSVCMRGFSSTGHVSEYVDQYTIRQVTIGSVRFDTSEKDCSYMCVETGVGSGQVYQEKNLFKEHKDAVTYAEKELAAVLGQRQKEAEEKIKRKKREVRYGGSKKP